MNTWKMPREPRPWSFITAITLLTVGLAWSQSTVPASMSPKSGGKKPAVAQNQVPGTALTGSADITPYRVNIPQPILTDLRERIANTRWPDKETVQDQSQGTPLAKIQDLVRYWGSDYDWRKVEAKLNSLPQFTTHLDGLNIHFIHVKSPHANALPLLITHGWPGSVLEVVKAIGPLTEPTKFGGRAEDAFHVVIPSMPGYGFSERPKETGWNPDRIGRAWNVLMGRLGYGRYVSQGGDWGSVVADAMGRQASPGLLGIHVNMPAAVPGDLMKLILAGDPPPANLTKEEKSAYEQMVTLFAKNGAYGSQMSTRPQALAYGLSDSPAGLAAWFWDRFAQWTYSGGVPERSLTKDEMLDDITLYWVTNTAASSSRLYWENATNNFSSVTQKTTEIKVPVAVTVFPGEIYRAPKVWVEKAYPTLMYFHEVDKGGHFASWEEPELFSREMRAAFKSLR